MSEYNNNIRFSEELLTSIDNRIPIDDPDDLESTMIEALDTLAQGNESVILEALLNTLVDYYIFCIEPGDDLQDIAFLVSDIEDRLCNAIAFRRHLRDHADDPDDDDTATATAIGPDPRSPSGEHHPATEDHPCTRCSGCVCSNDDPDDIRHRDIPGMMKRYESDGCEITVSLIPKTVLGND
mgnify:CR=1 FL=1